MSFNASKCFQMRITHKRKPIQVNYRLGNTILEEVQHNPYLGVELSKDFSWSTHIDQITSKTNRMLGLLKRNLYHCSTHTKDIAYKSLMGPKLKYCSAIWDPHHKSEDMFSLVISGKGLLPTLGIGPVPSSVRTLWN